MEVWNGSQTMWDSFQNLTLVQKNLTFIVSRTLACAHMPVYVYVCMKHAHAGLEHACVYACMRMHALGFLWPFFSKNSLFSSQTSYIFLKRFSSSQFQSG